MFSYGGGGGMLKLSGWDHKTGDVVPEIVKKAEVTKSDVKSFYKEEVSDSADDSDEDGRGPPANKKAQKPSASKRPAPSASLSNQEVMVLSPDDLGQTSSSRNSRSSRKSEISNIDESQQKMANSSGKDMNMDSKTVSKKLNDLIILENNAEAKPRRSSLRSSLKNRTSESSSTELTRAPSEVRFCFKKDVKEINARWDEDECAGDGEGEAGVNKNSLGDDESVADVVKAVGKDNGWTEEEIVKDTLALMKNRLRTVRDLRRLKPEEWNDIPDLLPIAKDLLRQVIYE